MTINQLANKRRRWVEASRENGFEEGIRNLLSDLYPDNAHFIYELLQNAEDAGASEVQFRLTNCSVEFEHNGNLLFSLDDVDAITSIGFTTKKDDPTKIGKFGIGFKAVFAYTSTPEIESGEYHFHIRDMVVPDAEGLPQASLGEGKTRFVFPFDNPRKPPQKAREEVEKNLRELDESTLIFLSKIRTIKYDLPNLAAGYLKRRTIDGNRIEITVKPPEEVAPTSTHYLLFEKDVIVEDADGVKDCRIAVAFGMKDQGNEGWKITPLDSGQVCIYFPAAKETSNLLFHLHAPFASTVARDSVRDDPANDELVNHLADLVAESMSTIRDKGLLKVEFLALLPNNDDPLYSFYLTIQERLIEAFNKKHLTPTKQGTHAPASGLYRGSSQLIKLIDDKDLATLRGKDPSLPMWVANPRQPRGERGRYVQDPHAQHTQRQNERVRNFLNMLEITEWTTKDFIEVLETEPEQVMEWLKEKQDPWHEELYVFLSEFLSNVSYSYDRHEFTRRLSNVSLVRCSDSIYRVGRECHFPSDDTEDGEDLLTVGAGSEEEDQPQNQVENEYEEDFHYVAEGVYSSEQYNDKEPQNFLETIGVREVDETERIRMILRQRYADPFNPREADMERFIKLVEADSNMAKIFESYSVFHIDKDLDDKSWWTRPSKIYLDSPYLNTGLKVLYETLNEDSEGWKWSLSLKYKESGLDLARLAKFAEAVGTQTKLQPTEQWIPREHPEYHDLVENALGQWRSDTGTNKDYTIQEFEVLLETSTIEKSRLIWRTMCALPQHCLRAEYQSNQSNPPLRKGHSSLVHKLRKVKWIPQKSGDSASFERPCDASVEYLLEGFQYDSGQAWLGAVEFGKTTREQEMEYILQNQRAQEMGFDSVDEAEKMAIIANDLKTQGKSPEEIIDRIRRKERRKELLIIDLSHADDRQYENRARSIRVSRTKIDPRTLLIEEYTTGMNEVECQMCRQYMPFKKYNCDEDYFEAVEALNKKYFPKEHESQYLALCPECAAKY